jgi:lipid-binding SYLF domain-containing protein
VGDPKGLLIVPTMVKVGFISGGSGGRGSSLKEMKRQVNGANLPFTASDLPR